MLSFHVLMTQRHVRTRHSVIHSASFKSFAAEFLVELFTLMSVKLCQISFLVKNVLCEFSHVTTTIPGLFFKSSSSSLVRNAHQLLNRTGLLWDIECRTELHTQPTKHSGFMQCANHSLGLCGAACSSRAKAVLKHVVNSFINISASIYYMSWIPLQ